MFDLARFWRVSPSEVMALPLPEFDLWEAQAIRIHGLERPD